MMKRAFVAIGLAALLLVPGGTAIGIAQDSQVMPELPTIAYDDMGFMTVKEAPMPPPIDEATALVIANEGLVDRWGIEKGGAVAAGVSATRFILFSQEPAIVDKPTWVIKYDRRDLWSR